MKLSATLLLCLVSLALPASASASDEYCGSPAASRAVILVHGGSFGLGGPYMTADSCQAFAARGYRVINSDYPLGDLLGAEDHLRRLALAARMSHQKVFVYGESAGGGLSALMAARGWVDGAYAWAPVSDLYRWQSESLPGFVGWSGFKDYDAATLKRVSAITWASKRSKPLLVVHGRADVKVPFAQSRRLKARYRRMTLRAVAGGHEEYEPSFTGSTAAAITWLARR